MNNTNFMKNKASYWNRIFLWIERFIKHKATYWNTVFLSPLSGGSEYRSYIVKWSGIRSTLCFWTALHFIIMSSAAYLDEQGTTASSEHEGSLKPTMPTKFQILLSKMWILAKFYFPCLLRILYFSSSKQKPLVLLMLSIGEKECPLYSDSKINTHPSQKSTFLHCQWCNGLFSQLLFIPNIFVLVNYLFSLRERGVAYLVTGKKCLIST